MFSSVVVLCRIQREMAFLNQLLDFNRLLFIKHPHPHFYQWSIFQFLGTTAVGGGGLSSPFTGDFETDNVMYRVRHVFGGVQMDPRFAYFQEGQA